MTILSNENEELKDVIETLSNERQQYKEQADRLKLENTRKWKFQERDDWKCLVESLQSDRTRLQDENSIVNHNIELEKQKVSHLEEEINNLSNDAEKINKLSDWPGLSDSQCIQLGYKNPTDLKEIVLAIIQHHS